MAEYVLHVFDPYGNRKGEITSEISLSYARNLNTPGTLSFKIAADRLEPGDIDIDYRLQVWRRTGDKSYIDTRTSWLVTKVMRRFDPDHTDSYEIVASSALVLLEWRTIAYSAGSSQANINGAADNMIKRLVRENLGSSAAAGRNLSAYLSVDADSGQGPTVYKQVSYRNLLQTAQEIARDAETQGTPIYFDILAEGGTGLSFRTWKGQPGVDRSQGEGRRLITLDTGALLSAEYGKDYQSAITVMYGLGQEFSGQRQVEAATDTTGLTGSPFARKEGTIDGKVAGTSDQLLAEAKAALEKVRPKTSVRAELAETSAFRYGIDWEFGDRLAVQIEGRVYICTVDSVSVSVASNGKEDIRASLKFA